METLEPPLNPPLGGTNYPRISNTGVPKRGDVGITVTPGFEPRLPGLPAQAHYLRTTWKVLIGENCIISGFLIVVYGKTKSAITQNRNRKSKIPKSKTLVFQFCTC